MSCALAVTKVGKPERDAFASFAMSFRNNASGGLEDLSFGRLFCEEIGLFPGSLLRLTKDFIPVEFAHIEFRRVVEELNPKRFLSV